MISRKLVLWLFQQSWYPKIVLKYLPYLRTTTYYPDYPGNEFNKAYNLLRPGDYILCEDRQKLTTKLIPGFWTHAVMCVSKDQVWETSDMTHENYRKACFFDICRESTSVVILRCKDFDEKYIEEVVKQCKTFQNALYDVQFKLGVKMLYCSELVYQSDFERRLEVNLEDLAGIGREYISPDGLYKAKNVEIIYEYRKAA